MYDRKCFKHYGGSICRLLGAKGFRGCLKAGHVPCWKACLRGRPMKFDVENDRGNRLCVEYADISVRKR